MCRLREIARDADLRIIAPREFFTVEGARIAVIPRSAP